MLFGFDKVFFGYMERPFVDWSWNNEYVGIFAQLCILAQEAVTIDAACYFSTILWILKSTYITNWQAFYARLVHYFWTLVLYTNYFIYGVVYN